MTRSKLTAAGMAALLVLSVFAAVPVAAQEESVSVETLPPIKVTEDKAELEGNLTALENASEATVWFEYWPENDTANATATENLTVSSVGTFVIDAEELESNTTYVAEAHAATENASAEGGEITFTTKAEPPLAVSTEEPTNVTNDSATFHGELTRLDADGSATVWFEYWALGDRDNATTTATQSLSAPGPFNASVDDLEPGTTYFVQAHGEAENETVAGAAVKFETETGPMPLGVETNAASAVTNDSATLNGELTGLGGADSADVWFEYWQQGDSANATPVGNDTLDEPGAFSEGVTGLANNTTYVYVAHAEANNTTVTGDEVEFTTGAAGPTWDGEGAFGQWVTGIIKNLVPADGQPLGQLVSDIVTANNPGSEHRSDKANPGGNSSGPPEHAGPPGDDANSTDDGNESERGPPEDAGPSDEANSTDDGNESGPPADAGPPEEKGNESEGSGPPDDAGTSDDDDGENGPPDDAGPPDEGDDEQSDDSDDDRDEEGENDEDDEDDDEESDDGGNGNGGPPDDAGNGNGNGNGNDQ